jgi:hypothetical protein
MHMQASTLRILQAANFAPPQAFALAEAIEAEVRASQVVTAPTFDARMSEFRGELTGVKIQIKETENRLGFQIAETENRLKLQIAETENRLFTKMATLGLSATAIIITAGFFIVLNLKK